MFAEINTIYILAFLLSTLTAKVDLEKNHSRITNSTFVKKTRVGSRSDNTSFEAEISMTNRSRKDYIIAIEDNAPMSERADPVFQSLQRLAKRTRGKMAVMDYTNNERRFDFPLGATLRYRNEIANDDDHDVDNYDDDGDDDDDDDANNDEYNEGFRSRLGAKQRLIGTNIIKNFLGLNIPIEEERPRQKDEMQGPEELGYDDKSTDFAPSVVYEIRGNRQDDYADYPDNDDEENQIFSRGNEPVFLFGNDKK